MVAIELVLWITGFATFDQGGGYFVSVVITNVTNTG